MNFWAFDTETVNRPGEGWPCLLVKSTSEGTKFVEFPTKFDQIFDFLRGEKYVCFNMDFDARAVLHTKFLPWRVVERIGVFNYCEWNGYIFKYVPSKFLTVRNYLKKQEFTLYDLKIFYGLSLAKATEKYLPATDRKLEIPQSWYSRMDERLRDCSTRAKILEYANRDVESTQALANLLLTSLSKMGLKARRLNSPASLAKQYFGKRLSACKPPGYINRIFERGFYGGRVEIGTLGRLENVRLYDIHSAYPSEISRLRTFSDFEIKEDGNARACGYGLYHVVADIPINWRWGPLAVADRGRNLYPVGRIRTYCGVPGLRALQKYRIKHLILKSWEFNKLGDLVFPEINDMYLQRKNPEISMAVKLIMNSAYGVMAEHRKTYYEDILSTQKCGAINVRKFGKFGRFANFVWASHLTEAVRIRVWEVLHQYGKDAHLAATDSVMLSGDAKMETGPNLGDWDLKGEFREAVILGCGRYVFDGGEAWNLRGFPCDPKIIKKLATCQRRICKIPVLGTKSLKEWARTYCVSDLNVLHSQLRDFKIEDEKRSWPKRFKRISDAWHETITGRPWLVWEGLHGRGKYARHIRAFETAPAQNP